MTNQNTFQQEFNIPYRTFYRRLSADLLHTLDQMYGSSYPNLPLHPNE